MAHSILRKSSVPPIVIRADFDVEASVWVAQSDEIPLVTEAESISDLFSKLPSVIQDVLDANGDARAGSVVPYELITQSTAEPQARVA
ncbi:DUF1902 domain-containing protein [Bradyrhizobium sp.]|uniref:DUF1902 domain-containing protein n=1 Tax=Bradyrhizobium sp. TaxID=376 RepID=UPI00351EA618